MHLFELVLVIGEGHDDGQCSHDRLPHALRLVLLQHLGQHGEDEGAPQLRLGRGGGRGRGWGGGGRTEIHVYRKLN